MSSPVPFTPATTVSLAVTNSSGNVAFGTGGQNVLLQNTGSVTAFIKFGNSTVTAATTDFPLQAGWAFTFSRGTNTNLAAITSSGSTTLYITTGEGQ